MPVCLDPRPRRMRGIGEILSEPLTLPDLPAVLVNPGVSVPTKDVFTRFGRTATRRCAFHEARHRSRKQREALFG